MHIYFSSIIVSSLRLGALTGRPQAIKKATLAPVGVGMACAVPDFSGVAVAYGSGTIATPTVLAAFQVAAKSFRRRSSNLLRIFCMSKWPVFAGISLSRNNFSRSTSSKVTLVISPQISSARKKVPVEFLINIIFPSHPLHLCGGLEVSGF
jgi:hypothetical protein